MPRVLGHQRRRKLKAKRRGRDPLPKQQVDSGEPDDIEEVYGDEHLTLEEQIIASYDFMASVLYGNK